jgi:hypothetical protein
VPRRLRPTASVRLAQRQRVQQDRAWDHESRGQHSSITGGANARRIRNDQLELAGKCDQPQGERDGEVGEAEDVPDDRRLLTLSGAGRHRDRRRQCEQSVNVSPMPDGKANMPSAPRADEPTRRPRIEHLPHPLRQQEQCRVDNHRQEDCQRQQREVGGASAEDASIAALQATANQSVW